MKKTFLFIGMLVLLSITSSFSQTSLSAGDIAFIGLNSDGNDDFSFVLLNDITSGTTINITDRGWNDGSSSFFTDETLSAGDYQGLVWTATSNMSSGQIVHIQTSNNGTLAPENRIASVGSLSGEILVSYTGDQLFAYQGTEASPTFIAGIHWNVEASSTSANWDGAATSNKTSALPDQLTNGVNAIWVYASGPTEKDNFRYRCSAGTSGTAASLREKINDISNWDVDESNTTAYTLDPFPCSFTVTTPVVLPTVTTAAASSITSTSASLGGDVTAGDNVTEKGVVYSTTSSPTTSDTKVQIGTGLGSFSQAITGLSANTNYYVRAYAMNSAGTAYGNEINFNTLPVAATVTTQAISSISSTTATGNGNITDLGTPNPTQYGVCWNTSGTPTIGDSKTEEGTASSTGAFTSNISGLSPYTTYFVRAYVSNTAGTTYGSQVSFTTLGTSPVITTQAVSDISATTATGNGNITDLGIPNPTQYGVCWNTAGTPTIGDNKTEEGSASSTGAFASNLTSLLPNTTYYVRAYATNATGTTYGSQVSFTTLGPPTITSFAPSEGAVGTTVTITGTNFSATPANNIVFFGATKATVSTSTATSLTVTVPAGATYAPLSALNTSTTLTAYSTSYFTPTFTPNAGHISSADIAVKVDYATGINPYAVAIGDIDGDGKPDLVAANYRSTSVSVFLNTGGNGTLSFASKVDFTTGDNPSAIAIGDIDGDGKPDVIVTNFSVNTVSVLRNTSSSGTLSFATKVDFSTGNAPYSIAIGDVDGDGKLDLIVGNSASSSISVLRNTGSYGNPNFAAKVDFTVGSLPYSIGIGDIDGDSKPDLAIANYNSSTISVLQNTGSIGIVNFASKVDFATGPSPNSVVIGDIDGDDKPDLAVVNNAANTISVFCNTSTSGTISLASKVDFSTGTNPKSVAISDIDGDGKADLAITNYTSNSVSVLRNTASIGTVSFSDKVDFSTGTTPRAIAIGDVDGDGKPDLVTANYNANSVSVLCNSPAFSPTVTTQAASDISATTATGNGNITDLGIPNPTQYGVCWNTAGTPTVGDSKTEEGAASSTGAFTSSLTSLLPKTIYYIRAYATNTTGTVYGNQLSFTTLTLQTTWNGSADNNGDNPANWSNGVPSAVHDVIFPDGAVIEFSGELVANKLTIEAGGTLSIAGDLTTNDQVIIYSDETKSGSLILNGSYTGADITYQRYMLGNQWHMFGSPLTGQSINGFLTDAANNIIVDGSGNYSMKHYVESPEAWSAEYTSAIVGDITLGQAYVVKRNADGVVNLIGQPNTSSINVAISRNDNGWNLLGNPFTSAIAATESSTNGINNLITANIALFDPSYASIYVWEENTADPTNTNNYRLINNAGTDLAQDYLQVGQGFFVKSAVGGGSFTITPAMQAHQTTTPFKISSEPWPYIKVNAAISNAKATTRIAFHKEMTNGLDIGYDAGLLNSYPEFAIYSRLIKDNGVDFGLQCLPVDYTNLTVPIGLDAQAGESVSFSIEAFNIPQDYAVILEDRALNSFTNLSDMEAVYQVVLNSDSKGTGRFYIHTVAQSALGLDNELITKPNYLVYAKAKNKQLIIRGEVIANTKARIFNLSGKLIKEVNLKQLAQNDIYFYQQTGIYLVQIANAKGIYTTKIVWIN